MNILKKLFLAITTKPALNLTEDEGVIINSLSVGDSISCEFIALEYYGLILNRTLVILASKDLILGTKVGGPLFNSDNPSKELFNAYQYVKREELKRVRDSFFLPKLCSQSSMFNFTYKWEQVKNITFNDKPKWGMGNVPYSGRLFFVFADGSKREFILLGRQNGPRLLKQLIAYQCAQQLR